MTETAIEEVAARAAVVFAVQYLNELVEADPHAMNALVEHRVLCNMPLAIHPTCQVAMVPVAPKGVPLPRVGLLGVINGLFGVDDSGWGRIGAVYDEDRLVAFKVRGE